MAPEAKSESLLYISDLYGVHIFSYPKGTPVGELTGFASPEGLCTDRAGDIFVTDPMLQDVFEFAHGGTSPIAVLYDHYVEFRPVDCSVDPTTGNVAAASADATYVVIFPNAKNTPKVYSDPDAAMFYCAYDNKGNLFVDDVWHRRKRYIGVLPKGTITFKNFLLDRRVVTAGSIQFDGKHVAIDDAQTNIIYQMRFSGSNAIVVGKTPLNGAKFVRQFWIPGRKVVGPDQYGTVYFWNYPPGGSPVKSIQGFTLPVGSTVSVSP